MKIYIASDHGGFGLKRRLIPYLEKKKFEVEDLGCEAPEACDYSDFAHKLAERVLAEKTRGILICGTGQGMAMTANKHKGIRAALCYGEEITRLARAHNDANLLCMGGRFIEEDLAKKIVDVFMKTDFAGGRHKGRVDKI